MTLGSVKFTVESTRTSGEVKQVYFSSTKAQVVSFFLSYCHLQNHYPNPYRKEGGKFGFAESIANQRITAFKMEKASVDTSNIEEKAEEIIAEAEPPPEVYLYYVVYTITRCLTFFVVVVLFLSRL